MSSDFGLGKRCAGNPEEIFENLAEGDTSGLAVTLSVRQSDYLSEILDMAKRSDLVGFGGVAGSVLDGQVTR